MPSPTPGGVPVVMKALLDDLRENREMLAERGEDPAATLREHAAVVAAVRG